MRDLHELKIWLKYADAVFRGEKTFEFRRGNRPYKVGDHIRFKVFDPETKEFKDHPINDKLYEITYLLTESDVFAITGQTKLYVVFSIKEVEP